MNYYEELGVACTASEDEIRQAFRQLARIVHPDHQSDPRLRELADLQMKRIALLRSILLDGKQRKEYDRSLRQERMPRYGLPGSWRSTVLRCAGSVSFLVVLLCIVHTQPEPSVSKASMNEAPPTISHAKPSPRQSAQKRRRVRSPSESSQQNLSHSFNQPNRAELQPDLTPLSAVPAIIAALPERNIELSARPMPPPPESPSLVGRWYYVRPPSRQEIKSVYRPEYIELRVSEREGILRGRYDARYSVSDRPISPLVRFQFEGREGRSEDVPWTGIGGAQGKVNLRLLSPDRLQVSWFVERPGTEPNFSEGSSVLVRYKAE